MLEHRDSINGIIFSFQQSLILSDFMVLIAFSNMAINEENNNLISDLMNISTDIIQHIINAMWDSI